MPSGLAATLTPGNGTVATLSWTTGGTETAWVLEYGTASDFTGATSVNVSGTPEKPLTGLTAETKYYARVKADCGGGDVSDWSNEVSFTTLCEAITIFPWTENFNDLTVAASIPNCWDNSEGTTTDESYKWNYYDTGHDGAGLCFDSYSNSNTLTNFLKTVSLSLPSDQLMQLSFWYKNPTGGDFSVYISTDGGVTHETALATGLTGVLLWTEHPAISLADYAGQEVVIVFKGTSNWGYGDAYIYLDDVTVMEVPSCMKPYNLEVTATTTTSATFSWTNGAADQTAWQICLNGDETNLIMAESNPFTVEDLNHSTAYTAKVRAYCSTDDQSDWSNEVSFATKCEAIVVDAANPFTEGFEGDWTPLCWESIPYIDGTNTRQWTKTTTSSLFIHSGAGAAFSGFYGPIYLVMPALQLGTDGNAAQLTFWSYNSYVDDYDKNSIVLLDGENEVELWTPESAIGGSWEEVTIDLTQYMGQTISLAFKYEGTDAHGWYVDDVEVTMTKTFTKTIEAHSGTDGWYLIASPLAETITDLTTVTNLINTETLDNFGLYRFNQAPTATDQDEYLEWENYKRHTEGFILEPGKGYLYANANDVTLTFTGTPYTGNGEVTLSYSDANPDESMRGWNLIGNPWSVAATIGNTPYYRINYSENDGKQIGGNEIIAGEGSIAPMEGIFVQADSNGETVTFSPATTSAPSAPMMAINILQEAQRGASKTIDRAVVRFGEGNMLSKFQLNPNHTKVYIPQDGKDYAIVNAGNIGEIPVCFKAENDGRYTMSFNAEEVTFNYLHLIDNMTGADVDLLATPSYSFDARTTDYSSRFRLVFATGSNDGDNFAFFSNGAWVISNDGEATLQVIDVTGRVLISETVNGSVSKAINAPAGVYMLRLINGNDVKTQKIVVR